MIHALIQVRCKASKAAETVFYCKVFAMNHMAWASSDLANHSSNYRYEIIAD